MTQFSNSALNIDTSINDEIEIEIPQQLINDYKKLNEQVDKTLQRINTRKRQTALKK